MHEDTGLAGYEPQTKNFATGGIRTTDQIFAEVVLLLGKPFQRPNPTAGKPRAHGRAEASHERLVDPPGGIPGAGGVVEKAEIPGGAARLRTPSLSFV